MAEILKFKLRPEAETRRCVNDGETAEVVIFPGVRYEQTSKSASGMPSIPPLAERF